MFILPNNRQINYEALIDAMLDQTKEHIYWFDAETGECRLGIILIKMIGQASLNAGKNRRYFKAPKITDFTRWRWMASYTEEMVEHENKEFADKIKKIIAEENSYDNFIKALEESKDGWIYGWTSWEGDNAFEEMKKWFVTLPFEIKEEMDHFDDDCPICRAMKEGRTSEKELKDAFREANFKNAVGDVYEQADPDNQKARK